LALVDGYQKKAKKSHRGPPENQVNTLFYSIEAVAVEQRVKERENKVELKGTDPSYTQGIYAEVP
jgi:hypothetical protein